LLLLKVSASLYANDFKCSDNSIPTNGFSEEIESELGQGPPFPSLQGGSYQTGLPHPVVLVEPLHSFIKVSHNELQGV